MVRDTLQNFGTFAVKFLKCVCPFWDNMYERVKAIFDNKYENIHKSISSLFPYIRKLRPFPFCITNPQ